MKIYCDGSGFNGQVSKWCVVLEDGTVKKGIIRENKTNNQMEYKALLNALKLAKKGDTIYTDSRLLEGQVMKNWKVNAEHLLSLVIQAKQLVKEKQIKIIWIPREKNLAGNILDGLKNKRSMKNER